MHFRNGMRYIVSHSIISDFLKIMNNISCKCNNSGSQAVHEKSPHIKSLLIAGPRGVGKKMLIHSICSETGANLFDLTAANIAGKYPGKAGLNMMMHMVFKVSHVTVTSRICVVTC